MAFFFFALWVTSSPQHSHSTLRTNVSFLNHKLSVTPAPYINLLVSYFNTLTILQFIKRNLCRSHYYSSS